MSAYANVKVLIAEDDSLNQRVIQMILKGLGCQSEAVDDGQQAVDAAAEKNYDLILMDFEMPGLNGIQAAQAIRQREERENAEPVPIIALSGHSRPEEKERCLAAGMNDYLAKPLTSATLKDALEQWLTISEQTE